MVDKNHYVSLNTEKRSIHAQVLGTGWGSGRWKAQGVKVLGQCDADRTSKLIRRFEFQRNFDCLKGLALRKAHQWTKYNQKIMQIATPL